jgi:hypothetical protein
VPEQFSDFTLNLPNYWFSGQAWANGIAQKFFREQYLKAIRERRSKPVDHKTRRFIRWFEENLDGANGTESSKG